MNTSVKYDYIFGSLTPVVSFSEDTGLYLYAPKKQLYVVKRMPAEYENFCRQLSEIPNPNVARILYIRKQADSIQIMYEYISGTSLAEHLKENGPFSETEAVRIIENVCCGLSAFHRIGLVHRDINPNNIILSSDGVAKIIDFGIMRSFRTEKNADTAILGTPGYAAPEQFGFSQSDARTDIYALGVLLNVLCTGKLPSQAQVGGKVGKIIRQCISIDSKKRFSSVEELQRAVHNISGTEGQLDRFFSLIPGIRSRNPVIAAVSVILHLFCLLLIVTSYYSAIINGWSILLHTVSVMFSVAIPYFCFNNFLDIWNRIPISKNSSKRSQRILYYTLGIVSLFVGLVIFGAVPSVHVS